LSLEHDPALFDPVIQMDATKLLGIVDEIPERTFNYPLNK